MVFADFWWQRRVCNGGGFVRDRKLIAINPIVLGLLVAPKGKPLPKVLSLPQPFSVCLTQKYKMADDDVIKSQ